MSNKIFGKILEEKIEFFKFSYSKTSKEIFYDEQQRKLIHPGEFGVYREFICRDFLRTIIPMRLDLGNGFIITDRGNVSNQIDIIIYDKNNTPLIENSEHQRFFPVETVVGLVEVKSDLSKNEFKVALNKLAMNKKLKEEMSNPTPIKRDIIGRYDPINYAYDNIFSILICNKLDFDISNLSNEIDSYYEMDILQRQKHNLVLSIEDGLLAYYDENRKTLMYPFLRNDLKNRLVKPDLNSNSHFYFASSYIFMGTTSASIYYPELTDYLTDSFIGGLNYDQNN